MFSARQYFLYPALGIVALSLAPMAQAVERLHQKLEKAPVPLQAAVDAAEQATGGRAYEAELEHNRFNSEYEVNLIAAGALLEVSIDAQTAKVLSVRHKPHKQSP